MWTRPRPRLLIGVVPGTTDDDVIARVAVDDVRAVTSADAVVARIAFDHVAGVGAGDLIVSWRTRDGGFSPAGRAAQTRGWT